MKYFKAILTGLAVCVLIYSAFSFGNWTLNAGKWGGDVRAICAGLMAVAIFASFVAYFDLAGDS